MIHRPILTKVVEFPNYEVKPVQFTLLYVPDNSFQENR